MLNVLQKIEDTRGETHTGPAVPMPFQEATYETGNLNRLVEPLPTPPMPGGRLKGGDVVIMQLPDHGGSNLTVGGMYVITAPKPPCAGVDVRAIDNSTVTIYGELNSPWAKYVLANELMHACSFEMQSLVYPKTHGRTDIEELIQQLTRGWTTPNDPLDGYENYAFEEWDGYDALPITPDTLHAARSILKSLPKTFGDPVCSPGADGSIVFEWLKDDGPLRKLFIDIGPGRTWKAYWRLASGWTGTIPRKRVTISTIPELQKLFKTLLRG